jgi:hypothetical protein
MKIGVHEVGSSEKVVKLGEQELGVIIDEVIKTFLPPGKNKIHVNKVFVLDGLSNRKLNLETGVRSKLTVVDSGKLSLGSGSKLGQIKDEVLDIGSKMTGMGSFLQIRKLGRLVLKTIGVSIDDGHAEFETALKYKGKVVGKAKYSTVKYHKLRELPAISKLVVPKELQDEVMGMPVIVSNSIIDIDTSDFSAEEDEPIEVVARENVEVGQLSPDHGKNIEVTVFYEITIPVEGDLPHKYFGTLKIDLGKFTYETVATDRHFYEPKIIE